MKKALEYAIVVVITLLAAYYVNELRIDRLDRRAAEDWNSCGMFIHKFLVTGENTAAFELVDNGDPAHGYWRQPFLLKDLRYCVVKKVLKSKSYRGGIIIRFYKPLQNVVFPNDRYFIDETTFEEVEYYNRDRKIHSVECPDKKT